MNYQKVIKKQKIEETRHLVAKNINLALLMFKTGADDLAYELIIKTGQILSEELNK